MLNISFFFYLASIVFLTWLPELVWGLYFILGLLFGLNLATLGRRQESDVGFNNKGLWSLCILYFVRTRSFKNDVMLWRAEKKNNLPQDEFRCLLKGKRTFTGVGCSKRSQHSFRMKSQT